MVFYGLSGATASKFRETSTHSVNFIFRRNTANLLNQRRTDRRGKATLTKAAIEKKRLATIEEIARNPEHFEKFMRANERIREKATKIAHEKSRKPVIRISANGETKTYNSIIEAARDVGVHQGAISNCVRGKTFTSAGYRWKYKEE